jgi:hypothetical protein
MRALADRRVVGAVDEHARQRVVVELHYPAAVARGAHNHIGQNGLDLHGAELQAGLGVETLDLGDHVGELFGINPDGALQGCEIVAAEKR